MPVAKIRPAARASSPVCDIEIPPQRTPKDTQVDQLDSSAKPCPTTAPPNDPTLSALASPFAYAAPNPSTFRPDIFFNPLFPTEDVWDAGVRPPRLVNRDGSLRAVDDWKKDLPANKADAIRQVAASLKRGDGAPYQYLAYGSDFDNFRPTINKGLERGGGECDWFTAVGYRALVEILGKDNIKAIQVFANGGWHNVVSYRDPTSNKWNIMNYQKLVSTEASDPVEAARSFFGNVELLVVYEVNGPDEKSNILYRARSDHQATLTASLATPGVLGAMTPNYGTTRGLNEGTMRSRAGNNTHNASQVVGTGIALTAQGAGVTVAVKGTTDSFDRAGVSYEGRLDNGGALGAKATITRDVSGKGWNFFLGGEYWHLDDNSYIGVVLGAELRQNIGTERMKDDQTLQTIAPALAVQGGNSANLLGDAQTQHQVMWFWNGRAQVAAPIVINANDREVVADRSNGMSQGGVLDPSFFGAAEIGVNTGFAAHATITPSITFDATTALRIYAQDPTLSGWPVGIGASADARLSYQSEQGRVSAGVQGGFGLYDRDVALGGYLIGDFDIHPSVSLGGSVQAGMFTDRSRYGQTNAGVKLKLSEAANARLGGGAIFTQAPDASIKAAPTIGIAFEVATP